MIDFLYFVLGIGVGMIGYRMSHLYFMAKEMERQLEEAMAKIGPAHLMIDALEKKLHEMVAKRKEQLDAAPKE
jgi:hypothetical protein